MNVLISAAILCGGVSSRMGRDKALLTIGGESFLKHLSAELGGLGPLYISVGEGRNYDGVPGTVVRDVYPGCGPLGGLHALLNVIDTDALFVTTVDLPLVDTQLAEELYSFLSPAVDAVVPVAADGRLHPVCAVYRRTAADVIKAHLDAGNYKVRDMLSKLRVCYVPVEKLTDGVRKLNNLNTPEDYAAFLSGQERPVTENRHSIPIAAISAYSGSGKTTFIEKLIPALKAKGYRLAIVKHDVHGIEIDHPGKDSYRFTAAGADCVILNGPDKTVRMESYPVTLTAILDSITEADLILLEGYKQESFRRMLLYREAAGKPLAFDPQKTKPLCIISDKADWPGVDAPVFGLEDIDGVANLLSGLIQK